MDIYFDADWGRKEVSRARRNTKTGQKSYDSMTEKSEENTPERRNTAVKMSAEEIYRMMQQSGRKNPVTQENAAEVQGSAKVQDSAEGDHWSDIIVKPDGSRVLVVTMKLGGMETTMSLEIAKAVEDLQEDEKQ